MIRLPQNDVKIPTSVCELNREKKRGCLFERHRKQI
jgi:hypothetical protein